MTVDGGFDIGGTARLWAGAVYAPASVRAIDVTWHLAGRRNVAPPALAALAALGMSGLTAVPLSVTGWHGLPAD